MIKGLLCFLLLASVTATTAQAQSVTATIHAGKTGVPISPYVYGQFIEHLGNIINHGPWAEMLEGRKFYAPVIAATPEPAPEPGAAWPRTVSALDGHRPHRIGRDGFGWSLRRALAAGEAGWN